MVINRRSKRLPNSTLVHKSCKEPIVELFRILKDKRIIITKPLATTEAFSENVLDKIIEAHIPGISNE